MQGSGIQHLLEVVEHDQHPPVARRAPEIRRGIPLAGVAHAELGGDRGHDPGRVGDVLEQDERDVPVGCRRHPVGDLDRETALADSTWPDEGHQAHPVPQRAARAGR